MSYALLPFLLALGCAGMLEKPIDPDGLPPLTPQSKPATSATRAVHEQFDAWLPFDDARDFDLAQRGLLARSEDVRIPMDSGAGMAWDMTDYAFIEGRPPATVNPSLWRQAQLNNIHGLFEVTGGIYQVRGYDLSNISFIAGDSGWLVIDPLITVESARAALALVNETLGERPVVAVLYSHSHADHFGGVRGVTTDDDVEAGRVRIVAPEGFSHHAVSENIVAGNVMTRRAGYMYGRLIEPGPSGRVDAGLGKSTSSGRVSMIAPTDIISKTGTRLTIDGVEIVFQNTPGAEAPAEMMFYFPHRKAFYAAEEASGVLHNLYTLRGAQVRSGKEWARWLDEAIDLFGQDFELVFGGHHWPRWGREEAVAYLASQRDLYKYIHDQTLHLANEGLTPLEIADRIALPETLATQWFNRDYYGTVNHNSRATYQLYLGFYDGNPANLNPHPPADVGERYVELAGGADAMLANARVAYERGDYRWVAEVLKHLVFSDPDHDEARWLQADALEQLGYQSESGPWRNFYLTGAQELRQKDLDLSGIVATASPDVLAAMESTMIFDFLAVSLDGEKAADEEITFDLEFTDRGERWLIEISRGVLRYHATRRVEDPTLSLKIGRGDFMAVMAGVKKMPKLLRDGDAELDGGLLALAGFGRLFDRFSPQFEIVKP
jgi:alkyl sulfatase BDS1-like metallo-beta-lactamase superfamily hydrolase